MNRENYRVLIVDDEKSFRLFLERIIQEDGYTVQTAADGREALAVSEKFCPHLVLTDLKMPVMDGLALMGHFKKNHQETDFIILTAYGTIDTAIQSIKSGALDYILKPLKEPEELRSAVEKAYERRCLIEENLALREELDKTLPPMDIIFAGMEELLDDIKAVASTDATVLLLGETGTGKSLIARVIHQLSGRRGIFLEVNCASVPENLLESEFYGHEKGAFTGAIMSKKGKFELSAGGTIFLDEISEMHGKLQAKLLRVLQDGTFERIGSNMTRKTDARVICATNKELEKEVSEGSFREDLYYRLNVFPLKLKPLRERNDHLAKIAAFILQVGARRFGKNITAISDASLEKSLAYDWPGNIRELQNVLERAIILSKGDELDLTRAFPQRPLVEVKRHGSLQEMEKEAIISVLGQTGGNRKKSAALLGISLRTLQYKIKGYGIEL